MIFPIIPRFVFVVSDWMTTAEEVREGTPVRLRRGSEDAARWSQATFLKLVENLWIDSVSNDRTSSNGIQNAAVIFMEPRVLQKDMNKVVIWN